MRNGFLFLAPFALVAGLHTACSSTSRPNYVNETEIADAGGGDGSSGGFGGFTEVDASADAQGCSETTTEILRIPLVIEFAIDESGSMVGSGVNDRWGAARDALLGAFADMKASADPGLFVGLLKWSSSVGDTVAPGPIADPNHYSDLTSTISKAPYSGGTAMLTGLTAAYKAVESFTPPAQFVQDQTKRAVVLLSDGDPNGGSTEMTQVENLVAQKYGSQPPKGPVLTFSVGIGPFPASSSAGYNPAFMSRVAQKGGTAPPGCSPTSLYAADLCHFQITPAGNDNTAAKQALVDAFQKIRAATATCEFSFTKTSSTSLDDVRVEITDADGNKSEVPKDPDSGWSFDDDTNPTKVILHGEACDASTATVSGKVNVVLGCRLTN